MNNYLNGSAIIGADADYGPPSPQQLMAAKRPLSAPEQGMVDQWKAAHPPEPSFLQREAFGGLKTWQVAIGGGGLVLMIGGLITLIAKKRK